MKSELVIVALAAAVSTVAVARSEERNDAVRFDVNAPRPVPVEETRIARPNVSLLVTGGVSFAASYIPAVIVGVNSNRSEDKNLFVPVVGPIVDFAQRPTCGPAEAHACDTEGFYKGLMLASAIFQAAGLAQIGFAFVVPERRYEMVPAPRVSVSPVQLGTHGYGLGASGAF